MDHGLFQMSILELFLFNNSQWKHMFFISIDAESTQLCWYELMKRSSCSWNASKIITAMKTWVYCVLYENNVSRLMKISLDKFSFYKKSWWESLTRSIWVFNPRTLTSWQAIFLSVKLSSWSIRSNKSDIHTII